MGRTSALCHAPTHPESLGFYLRDSIRDQNDAAKKRKMFGPKSRAPTAILPNSELCFLPWDRRYPEQWASWRRIVTKQRVRAQTTQGRLPMPLVLAKTRLGPAVAGWRSQGPSKSSPSRMMTQCQIVVHVWLPENDPRGQELETSGQARTGEGVGHWRYRLMAKPGWLVSTFASPRHSRPLAPSLAQFFQVSVSHLSDSLAHRMTRLEGD